jgi:hypothetical protein
VEPYEGCPSHSVVEEEIGDHHIQISDGAEDAIAHHNHRVGIDLRAEAQSQCGELSFDGIIGLIPAPS